MTLQTALRALPGLALDALLPPRCLVCGGGVARSGALCGSCWSGLTFLAPPFCGLCRLVPFVVLEEQALHVHENLHALVDAREPANHSIAVLGTRRPRSELDRGFQNVDHLGDGIDEQTDAVLPHGDDDDTSPLVGLPSLETEPHTHIHDRLGRPFPIADGDPLPLFS